VWGLFSIYLLFTFTVIFSLSSFQKFGYIALGTLVWIDTSGWTISVYTVRLTSSHYQMDFHIFESGAHVYLAPTGYQRKRGVVLDFPVSLDSFDDSFGWRIDTARRQCTGWG